MHVVWDELKVPGEFSGFGVEGDDRVRVKIAARPGIIVEVRRWISPGDVEQVLLRVIGKRSPQRTPSVFSGRRIGPPGFRAGLAVSGNNVEAPQAFAIAQPEGSHPAAGG